MSPAKLVRYAVVGLGYIAQVAVPGVRACSTDSKLVAVVSDDRRNGGNLPSATGSSTPSPTTNSRTA
jgi:predicted dehydrogenase